MTLKKYIFLGMDRGAIQSSEPFFQNSKIELQFSLLYFTESKTIRGTQAKNMKRLHVWQMGISHQHCDS